MASTKRIPLTRSDGVTQAYHVAGDTEPAQREQTAVTGSAELAGDADVAERTQRAASLAHNQAVVQSYRRETIDLLEQSRMLLTRHPMYHTTSMRSAFSHVDGALLDAQRSLGDDDCSMGDAYNSVATSRDATHALLAGTNHPAAKEALRRLDVATTRAYNADLIQNDVDRLAPDC